MFATVSSPEYWWPLRGPLVARSACRVTVPIPGSFGKLSAAVACDIEDRENLNEKLAQVQSM
jgi:hypothetical protein